MVCNLIYFLSFLYSFSPQKHANCPGTCANIQTTNFDLLESLKDYDGKSASHRGGSDSSDDIEIDADAEEDSSGNCEFRLNSDNCYTCR